MVAWWFYYVPAKGTLRELAAPLGIVGRVPPSSAGGPWSRVGAGRRRRCVAAASAWRPGDGSGRLARPPVARPAPADLAPIFTFAHILLPHVPYLLDERCRPLASPIPDDMEADIPEQRAYYIRQVRYVDGLVLDIVTTVLRRSTTPPMILVVGDHGQRFADIGFYGHSDSISTAVVRERFGAFGAFYLPDGGEREFREPVTLVNVLGNVLRYYFHADLPSSGKMYVSGEQPYLFYAVDPQVLGADPGEADAEEP